MAYRAAAPRAVSNRQGRVKWGPFPMDNLWPIALTIGIPVFVVATQWTAGQNEEAWKLLLVTAPMIALLTRELLIRTPIALTITGGRLRVSRRSLFFWKRVDLQLDVQRIVDVRAELERARVGRSSEPRGNLVLVTDAGEEWPLLKNPVRGAAVHLRAEKELRAILECPPRKPKIQKRVEEAQSRFL